MMPWGSTYLQELSRQFNSGVRRLFVTLSDDGASYASCEHTDREIRSHVEIVGLFEISENSGSGSHMSACDVNTSRSGDSTSAVAVCVGFVVHTEIHSDR